VKQIVDFIVDKLLFIAFLYAVVLVMYLRWFNPDSDNALLKNKFFLIITTFFVGCLLIWIIVVYLNILGEM
jgi:hypothetical protein